MICGLMQESNQSEAHAHAQTHTHTHTHMHTHINTYMHTHTLILLSLQSCSQLNHIINVSGSVCLCGREEENMESEFLLYILCLDSSVPVLWVPEQPVTGFIYNYCQTKCCNKPYRTMNQQDDINL